MSVPKHRLVGGLYPWGLIVHQQRYLPSESNKNVDIKFSVHNTFLEQSQCQKTEKPNNSKAINSAFISLTKGSYWLSRSHHFDSLMTT